jgi:hypothetical protein
VAAVCAQYVPKLRDGSAHGRSADAPPLEVTTVAIAIYRDLIETNSDRCLWASARPPQLQVL